MRNLFRRSFLLAALPVAFSLISSDVFSAGPAGAIPRTAAPVTLGSKAIVYRRPVHRINRGTRVQIRRVSRSAALPGAVAADAIWARLRQCESGGRYDVNTGNGFFGAYQFHPGTWRGLGFPGLPHQASAEVQDAAARKLQARSGWGQWPVCSRRIGAR